MGTVAESKRRLRKDGIASALLEPGPSLVIDRPETFCVVCDAEPGGCEHHALRYHDPLTYAPAFYNGAQIGWTIPTWHGEKEDAYRLEKQLRERAGRASAPPPIDPSLCPCGEPLATWALVRGFRHCSKECRETYR